MLLLEVAMAFVPSIATREVGWAPKCLFMGAYDFANQPLGGKGIDEKLDEQRDLPKTAAPQQEMYGVLGTTRLQEGQANIEQKALGQDYHPGEQEPRAFQFRPPVTP